MSTPSVSLYTYPNLSDDRSVSSLPTTEPSLVDSDIDPTVKLIPKDEGSNLSTPGGLPIPFISTTGPESPTRSSSFLPPPIYRSTSLPAPSSPVIQSSPRLGQILTQIPSSASTTASLPVPSHHRQPRDDLETEESSGAESDASVATSTLSMESSRSVPLKPVARITSAPVRKKPKPVIMRPAYKRYLIGTPPPVLVIHLKRFQQISKTHMLSFSHGFKKLDDYVTFPEYLDLTPYLAPKKEDFGLGKKGKAFHGSGVGKHSTRSKEEKCMYRLYAVVVHIGNMLGGHYIAYTALPDPPQTVSNASSEKLADVKPPRQWAYISDTIVRLTTLEEVLKAKAYICLYEQT